MPQQCSSCDHPSPDGAKFCLECGTPFARACPACGHPVAGGKFCMECGTPLTAAAAPPAPPAYAAAVRVPAADAPVSERRTTTVLFGDLVSFTTLSESRDPEEVRELLSEYFAVARTVVGRYGGTIEKFIGDAVMAVWGVPVSHEDDAERAVRAGLDLVAEVAALGAQVGAPDLAMRVGIVTGSVAVTLGATNEGMVAGDAVNTAARVQTAAEPGTVYTDAETRGLTAAAVAYTDAGEHTLKGKAEPARLFRADAVVAAVGGAQRVDGLEAPLTGRDAELRQVKELFHATQTDGRPRVVLVSAVPGMGKSRLGWEFEKYVDGLSDRVRWHRGRSLSYGESVAFWAFAEMVRSRVGLLEGEDRGTTREKVRDAVTAVAVGDGEAEWLAPRVEALLGTWDGPAFDRTDLFAAWTTFLDRVGGEGEAAEPVVLLFEDMQFADSGLLDLLEHVLETTRARVFVLALTRPELLDQRPSLASGRRATVVELGPLPEASMVELVDGLVADLPEAARAAIVGRSDGVPLYAVETVRSLIDRDAVVPREGRYVFTDHDHRLVDLEQLAAPTSLQTLIASRLDALTPLERRTVQDASVLGLSFRHAGLMALNEVGGYELDQALAGLTRKGVVEAQGDPRSPELGQYRFLQALVREVAYSTLARKDRRARHLAAAAHLETEASEDVAGIVAQHLLDALEASATMDTDRDEVSARARAHLAEAARRAMALGSFAEALEAAERTIALEPEPVELAPLQELASKAAWAAGQPTRSAELAAAAFAGFEALGRVPDVVRVVGHQTRLAHLAGRSQEAIRLGTIGVGLVEQHPDVPGQDSVELLSALGNAHRGQGDLQRSIELALQQLRVAEQSGDPALVVRGLSAAGIAMIDVGSPTAYLALMEGAVAMARRHHVLQPLSNTLANLAAELYPRDVRRAVTLADEAVEVAHKVGDPMMVELSTCNAQFAWRLLGRWDDVVSAAHDWLTDRELSSFSVALLTNAAWVQVARGEPVDAPVDVESEDPWEQLAQVLWRALHERSLGAPGEATRSLPDAVQAAYGDIESFEDFEVLWSPSIELLLESGDLAGAERVLAVAAPLDGPFGRPLLRGELPRLRGLVSLARGADPEADLREAVQALDEFGAAYLAARARLALGGWLHGQGRHTEAEPLLTAAREVFADLGARPSVEEVDALAVAVPA